MGKHPYKSQWSGQLLAPLEQRRHGMIGEGIRQQREESLGNSQGLGKGMLWHGNPSLLVMLACVGLWVAVRPWSLATSYLALVAARIQGINLSLTPLPETNQIPWERWGVTQRMLLSSCPPSFPITLVHQPSTFSSCVSTKSNTLPFCHWCPQLANLKKTMWLVYLFATWTIKSLKLSFTSLKEALNSSLTTQQKPVLPCYF